MKPGEQNQQFDQFIRSGLQEQEYTYDPATWESLHNKYTAVQSELRENESLSKTLADYNEAPDPLLWNKLYDTLATLKMLQRNLLLRKSFEVLLVLFASWWYVSLVHVSPDSGNRIVQNQADAGYPIQDLKGTTAMDYEGADSHESLSSTGNEILEAGTVKNYQIPSSNSAHRQDYTTITDQNKQHNQNTTLNKGSIIHIAESSYRAPDSRNAKVPVIIDSSTSTVGDLAGLHDEIPQQITTQENQAVELEHLSSIALRPVLSELMISPLKSRIATQSPKQWFWLSIAAGIDKDLIKSPYPTQISPDNLGRLADNYSIRIGVLFNYKFFDLQTRMNLGFKNYESVYTGNNQVRVISVPLIARVKLKQVGAFRGYVLGGFVANYVGYANYSEFDLFKEMPHLALKENNRKIRDNALLSSAAYDSGIMEGETIKGNHYYTLNMGIGFEYAIYRRYKLFLEQTYDHQINSGGIGPGFDRFYTSTTAVGIRALMYR